MTKGELTWWSTDHDPLLFDFVDTSVEATATALQALAVATQRMPLIDRAVRWLMLNRRGGYWSTTKQTAMALYGLLEVMQARNETPQPFSVDVFVNGTLARTQSFTAASLTAPDPIVRHGAGTRGREHRAAGEAGGGTLYWSARATYYDTQGAASREAAAGNWPSRASIRGSSPTRVNDRIVYRETRSTGR